MNTEVLNKEGIMRKTISNGINRRAVYKFQCTGPCSRMKFTYVYDRAKAGVCLSCSKNSVNPNQSSLFDEADGESVEVLQEMIVGKGGELIDMRIIGPNGEVLRDFQYPNVSEQIKKISEERDFQEENQGYPLPDDFKKLKDVEV